jgi:protein-S-isoprenylcysteine O-methyltransferase Ste14
LLIGWLVGLLRPFDASVGIVLPDWVRTIGFVPTAFGAVGVLACGVMLSTRGIGTLPRGERLMPKVFLASGPFRFVRNPMSLAGTVLIFGIALVYKSTLGLGVAVVLFAVFHAVIVLLEEPALEQRFGNSYREYCRHVPRWLPRLTPWTGEWSGEANGNASADTAHA